MGISIRIYGNLQIFTLFFANSRTPRVLRLIYKSLFLKNNKYSVSVNKAELRVT